MFLTCHYFSRVLRHNVEVNVVIPTPEGNEQITDQGTRSHYNYEAGLPVVYLLHGAYGDNSSWMRNSCIERYLQAHCCVGVMAAVENSFYQDMAYGNPYHTFMTEELPAYVTSLFPVSKKREDTFVAGFSMGGYGAWYLGLSRPDLYGKAASMSGALDIAASYQQGAEGTLDSPFPWHSIFRDPARLAGSDADLFELYRRDAGSGLLPELYQACGTRDFLIGMNRDAHARFTAMGAKITYHETEGHMHNWDYWDEEIQNVLDWLFR